MKNLSELLATYGDLIDEIALEKGVDPAILAGLIWQESRGNMKAISPCGAIGLTQVMPATAKDRGYNLLTAKGQIRAGADYLAYVLRNFAGMDYTRALAGYNAGPGRIRGDRWKRIKETREYVPKVLAFAAQIRKLKEDANG